MGMEDYQQIKKEGIVVLVMDNLVVLPLPSLGEDAESTNNYDYIGSSTGPTPMDEMSFPINNQYSIGYEGGATMMMKFDGGWWWERDVGTEPCHNLGSRTNGNLQSIFGGYLGCTNCGHGETGW